MVDEKPDAEVLLNLGFQDVAAWRRKAEGEIVYEPNDLALFDAKNALYAFVNDGKVLYIGKTARSIRRRFVGYCKPGNTQATNARCHKNIGALLEKGESIRLLVFIPVTHLCYGKFEINLAAGLEESLIDAFSPPWNIAVAGRRITETEEEEREILGDNDVVAQSERPTVQATSANAFQIKLGETYWSQGFINPGVAASRLLAGHGEPVIVYLGGPERPVNSVISRTANQNGSVRIIGNNGAIAKWFQANFRQGDNVMGEVIDPQHMILRKS